MAAEEFKVGDLFTFNVQAGFTVPVDVTLTEIKKKFVSTTEYILTSASGRQYSVINDGITQYLERRRRPILKI